MKSFYKELRNYLDLGMRPINTGIDTYDLH